MAYKTLLTHVAGGQPDTRIVQIALDLADKHDAHLDILCHGVDQMTAGFHYGGADPMLIQQSLQNATDDAEAATAAIRAVADASVARWSTETCVSAYTNLPRVVSGRSRFSDIVLLPTPYGEGRSDFDEVLAEASLIGSGTPVLFIPDGTTPTFEPQTVVIGWNESAEALNAVKAALPLLKAAQLVRVTVIDPPRHGPSRSDPGGPLSVFLARHGIKAEVDVLGKSLPRVSDVLARHANDTGAELMVMGGYGRSRLSEAILGGATRNMLEQAKLPVLMAH